jgi:protein gp37
MSDLFHEQVPFNFIDRVFATICLCPQHTFQILTKRAERMRLFMDRSRQMNWGFFAAALLHAQYGGSPRDAVRAAEARGLRGFPPINTWLGVSAEDQTTADERIPQLRQTPAHVRFVSCEPLLERLDLTPHLNGAGAIDWVIVGAESGPKARPFSLEWLEDLIEQCKHAGVPIFAKQVGARPSHAGLPCSTIAHRKGADMREWPERLRIREFPREGVRRASLQ